MHPATKKVQEQIHSMLESKGADPNNLPPEAQSMIHEKLDDVEEWMAHKPSWVDDNTTPQDAQ